ncbi:DAR GTPase 3, chloroplastic-like [Benincasa hispida]|uniref:DAR GTPase 3, chloroplastic-like n=1 Tax=Benincasa hispida TaxID=102211 RepID=UPI001901B3BF|nr:DAR GTPase 3, chloroplastic-like [Benincasa hispida]
MDAWLGNRRRILVLNREDMISSADRNAWAAYFTRQGIKVVFSNGQLGMGTMKLGRLAKTLAADVNVKRGAKGLLPRAICSKVSTPIVQRRQSSSRFPHLIRLSQRKVWLDCFGEASQIILLDDCFLENFSFSLIQFV